MIEYYFSNRKVKVNHILFKSKNFLICFFISAFIIGAKAQDIKEKTGLGIEIDVLPYLTGGYFGAVWVGKHHFRARALYADVNLPQFIVQEGFTMNHISSFALVGDYFFNKSQRGLWLAGGPVFWKGSISTDQMNERVNYNNWLLNGSMGYAINFNDHFYCSPWAGLSLRVGGSEDIIVDGLHFKPPFINPELSLKFGYRL